MAQMANLHHRRRQRRLSGQELSRRNRFDVDVESGLLNGESNRVWHAVPYDDERPSSGPIAGTLTPARKGDVAVPYLSLREHNMEQQQRISISSSPIYLVT
ncbi:hypothetical protein HID58_096004 [Brassica napus]|uniref:Uncharacterized protein n=1 Tax=Brassica napus TaxID=3708 RepID=A0ABQ7X448_BRANA|nr:hypothetical protein HID58_096004 [Brassica napus]